MRGRLLSLPIPCLPTLNLRRTVANLEKRTQRESDLGGVRSFLEIPEVRALPAIGTLLDYTPFRGFKPERIFELWAKRHDKYGDIYKEKLMGEYVVFCRSKEAIDAMFQQEGRFPSRKALDSISYLKRSLGLPETFINLSGEEWHEQRKVVNGPLLMNKMVWKYVVAQMKVTEDLTNYILRNVDDKREVPNFDAILDRWAFEMSAAFLLDCRMGLLDDSPPLHYFELFDGIAKGLQFVADSFMSFNLWKYIETRQSRGAVSGLRRSYEIMAEIIDEKKRGGELEDTVLQQLMKAENLTHGERISLVYDVFGASVETTSKSSALMVYCLTLNHEAQEKLREEVDALPPNELLTGRILDGMKYMNAFTKEAVRLFPLAHTFMRSFEKDVAISGYRVIAGTPVLNTSNSTMNKNPEYFWDPERFLPERWIAENRPKKNLLTGPFGMGARACPGRRFAMQEMRLLLIELVRNFRVEYHYKPMESVFRATGYPSEKPRFTFKPLNQN